jgi:hypothetical protein
MSFLQKCKGGQAIKGLRESVFTIQLSSHRLNFRNVPLQTVSGSKHGSLYPTQLTSVRVNRHFSCGHIVVQVSFNSIFSRANHADLVYIPAR